jgi:mRNA-degrading endonuclease toxin of MazEF toxin-antitoxin module
MPKPRVFRGHVFAVRIPDTGTERLRLAVSDRDYGNPERGWTFVGAPLTVEGEPSPTVVRLSDPRLRGAGFVHCGELESVLVAEVAHDLGEVSPTDIQRVDIGLRTAVELGTPPPTP